MNYLECRPQERGWRITGKVHATWAGSLTLCGRRIEADWHVSTVPFLGNGYRDCQNCTRKIEQRERQPSTDL